jgi:hypothetical protein
MHVDPPVTILPLASQQAFWTGVLGALLGYFVLYRDSRIAEVIKDPRQNWRLVLFDALIYLACGGLVTAYLVVPSSPKEAFTGGLAWQAIAGGAVAGTELATYRKGAPPTQPGGKGV